MKRRLALQHASPLKRQSRRINNRFINTSSSSARESVVTTSQDGDTRTFRSRTGGNRALPLPPIIDPVRISQRSRHKKPKAAPPKHADLTPFQRALVNNPYAQALSQPNRFCYPTSARLPSFFMIRLDAKIEPKLPNRKWLLPIKLMSESSPTAPATPSHGGLTTFIQARKSLFNYIRHHSRGWLKAIGPMHEKVTSKDVWRPDMEELVLDLLRDSVVRALRWGLKHPRSKGVVKCEGGAEHAGVLDDIACVIYIPSLTSQSTRHTEAEVNAIITRAEDLRELEVARGIKPTPAQQAVRLPLQTSIPVSPPRMNPKLSDPPLRFPTVRYRDRLIPVYSFEDLLGDKKTKNLLKDTVFEESRCLALKDGNLTVGAQKALLRLQGYIL